MRQLLASLPLGLWVLCFSSPAFSQTTVSQNITQNTVWDLAGSPYVLTQNISVSNGATLTIEPGVVVKADNFDFTDPLTVNGTLLAQGTALQPIVFTDIADDEYGGDTNGDGNSTAPHAGDWGGIRITANSGNSSLLEYCLFRYGGDDGIGDAALEIVGSSPTISNCTFFSNEKGLVVSGTGAPTFIDNTFEANVTAPIGLALSAQPNFSGTVFLNNSREVVILEAFNYNAGGESYTLGQLDIAGIENIAYLVDEGGLTINTGVTLTIEPGVVIKHDYFDSNDLMVVNGTLIAQGTALEPIVFTDIADDAYGGDTDNDGDATEPHAGDWGGIRIGANSGNSSLLEYCLFRFGGDKGVGDAGLEIDGSSPMVSNCTFFNNEKGISIFGNGAPSILDNTFEGCTVAPVGLALTAQPTFSGNIFIDNLRNGINLEAFNYNATGATYTLSKIALPGLGSNVAYIVNETGLTIGAGVTLTIEPGVIIKHDNFDTDDLLTVNGTLIAQGTALEPVVFTDIADDAFGGDTDNNGSAVSPHPGDWEGIRINAASGNTSALEFCLFRYGGNEGNTDGALEIAGSSPTVENCTFFSNEKGISISGNGAPGISGNTFEANTRPPVSLALTAQPSFLDNVFVDNLRNGVGIEALNYNNSGDSYTLGPIAINGNQTAAYIVTNFGLTIGAGVTLTIEPGVIVKHDYFDSNDLMTINGTLIAQGSIQQPIVFTDIADDAFGGDTDNNGNAVSPHPGDWEGIRINAESGSTSMLQYCVFRYGGDDLSTGDGALEIAGSSPTVSNCMFTANETGIVISSEGAPNLLDNSFAENTTIPIAMDLSALPVFDNNLLLNNTYNGIGILALNYNAAGSNYTLGATSLSGAAQTPYVVYDEGLTIGEGVSLTIEPGVIVKFAYRNFDQLYIDVAGTVVAEGTPQEPIVFTSARDDTVGGDTDNNGNTDPPTYGDWYGWIIGDESGASSSFSYCHFRHGGFYNFGGASNYGAVRATGSSAPTIEQCTFYQCSEGVVAIDSSGPVVQQNAFLDCGWSAVAMTLGANPVFSENTIDANTIAGIGLWGAYTTPADYVLPKRNFSGIDNIPYFVHLGFSLEQNVNLTIQPGVALKFYTEPNPFNNLFLLNKGKLIAEGTQGEPIVFTSWRDDEIGGDTNNGVTQPSNQDWYGLIVQGPGADESRFRFCQFRYGGFRDQSPDLFGALRIDNSSPSVEQCTFFQNKKGLVTLTGAAVMVDSSDFAGNEVGLSKEGGTIEVHQSNFEDNISYGVENLTTADLDATLNWWGDASGPFHPTANPGGQGDAVTDHVLFDPWLNQPVAFPNDIGVTAILAPQTDCGLSAAESVTLQLTNFGNLDQTNFEVVVRVDDEAPVVENVGGFFLPALGSAEYTLSATVDLSASGDYQLTAYTQLPGEGNLFNDTASVQLSNIVPIDPGDTFNSLIPEDGTENVTSPLNFSWSPIANAEAYDLYLWKAVDPEPLAPSVAGISQINYQYAQALEFGEEYRWKVVARNVCSELSSANLSFFTADLPDLAVVSISVPLMPFSGQEVEIGWEVVNQGVNNTGGVQWFDAVYLSFDQLLDAQDTYLGAAYNNIALNPGEGYSQTADFTLPDGLEGDYYLIVVADDLGFVEELDETNNDFYGLIDISLTPPPDLQVTSLIAPGNAFSGQSIDISWTVGNEGTGSTVAPFWRDRLMLSPESDNIPFNAFFLGTFDHIGVLDPGESYSETRTVNLPQGISGTYYLFVETDRNDHVFEFANEGNNLRSDSIVIFLTPPPDLVVSSLEAPATGGNLANVLVQWTVLNQGASTTTAPWYDRIFLSDSPELDPDEAVVLKSVFQNQILEPGESFSDQESVTLPGDLAGAYYLHLLTDAFDYLFEYVNEDNNASSVPIQLVPADLAVANVSVPGMGNSGESFAVEWVVENVGLGPLSNIARQDRLYFSQNPVFDPGEALLLDSLQYSGSLLPGQSTTQEKTVTLPDGQSGPSYLHVVTDATENVYEPGAEANNVGSAGFDLDLSPWPDLEVFAIEGVPASTVAGSLLTVTYRVRNNGEKTIQGEVWADQMYLSPDTSWNPDNALPLKQFTVLENLAQGEVYDNTTSFILPMLANGAMNGVCFLYFRADDLDELYEHTDEDNNILRSDPISVEAPPPVDLEILSATTAVSTTQSGQPIEVQWQVRNNGSASNLWNYPFWYDAFYLSTDQIFDAGDLFVKDYTEPGPIGAGEVYSDQQTFLVPPGLEGSYYLLLVSDHTGLTNDDQLANNVWSVTGDPIFIEKTFYPDLVAETFQAPAQGTAGQPIEIAYTVRNDGEGATLGSSWTDKVYLSTDFAIDGGDPVLGIFNHSGTLALGAEYTETQQVFLPITASGNYILLFKTDANNNEYENGQEANNRASAVITATIPPPSDLTVTEVIAPAMGMVGETVAIEWTVRNEGVNPAIGTMKEVLYLSADTLWDLSDLELVEVQSNINLPPFGSTTHQVVATVPGIALGDYYVVAQTDALNNIFEDDEFNNLAVSALPMTVSIAELPLDVLTPNVLADEQSLYYRIEIEGALENETLLVTLKGDSLNGANELYLSYGTVPSRSMHQFSAAEPFAGNQQLVVPALQAGTYYLLAYGVDAVSTSQDITLLAQILPFEIRSVHAAQGGNTGTVTVKLEGAKFEEEMELRLEDATLGTIVAHDQYYHNSTVVYATFNLIGAELGQYDVVAEKSGGELAVLDDGFEVVTGSVTSNGSTLGGDPGSGFSCSLENIGTEELLVENIYHPPNTRLNRIVAIQIQFQNNGNIDVPTPTRFLISLEGAPLAFDVNDLPELKQELFLEFQETDGPKDVLRPGAKGSIKVFTKAIAPLRFYLTQ